ncbi:MAG: aminopeptidase P family protein [Cyclobacteriaceae bacterium]|nr:aminopeptidase P family protein [Cyclobacteriaceae bacterium]
MKRIRRLQKKLVQAHLDGLLLISEPNISYLTGFTGDSSRLLVTRTDCVFLTDGRYSEQAALEIHPEIEVFKWINDNRYGVETYQKFVDEYQLKRLGFESSVMSHAIHQKFVEGIKALTMVPTTNLVEDLRMIKDAGEIAKIRKACEISDRALRLTLPFIKPGITEQALAARLEYNLKSEGANGISFETIVVSGERTSLLHGRPGKKKLANGELVLIDFGALYQDYHADISRTFVMGKANSKQRELYSAIQQAEMEAILAVKPGARGDLPDQSVRQTIPAAYLDFYYPGLGHGLGLEIHEPPYLRNTSDFTFAKGMALSIEPGVYLPGWGGIRIEDTVLVVEGGLEMLTNFPRELMEL